jgi:hypothetical protein
MNTTNSDEMNDYQDDVFMSIVENRSCSGCPVVESQEESIIKITNLQVKSDDINESDMQIHHDRGFVVQLPSCNDPEITFDLSPEESAVHDHQTDVDTDKHDRTYNIPDNSHSVIQVYSIVNLLWKI